MKRSMTDCLLLLAAWISLPAAAASPWLIATEHESARSGAAIAFEVVKPQASADWPAVLRARLRRDATVREFELTAAEADDPPARRRYVGRLPEDLTGWARVDLADVASNRLALLIEAADAGAGGADDSPREVFAEGARTGRSPQDELPLSVNEPVYFLFGTRGGHGARFQLSVKYRLFDADTPPVRRFPLLSGLYFGYTQNSLWDLGADSSPFRETNYRPSFFWEGVATAGAWAPPLLRAGYEHESNGKDTADSRSINTLFAQPIWRKEFSDGRVLVAAPKFYGYLTKKGNRDIEDYRGYADWIFRYGHEDGWLGMAQLRRGTAVHGSAQFDLSYPLRRLSRTRTGGFVHFQIFKGYGESLLDYNVRHGTRFRIGFSVVR